MRTFAFICIAYSHKKSSTGDTTTIFQNSITKEVNFVILQTGPVLSFTCRMNHKIGLVMPFKGGTDLGPLMQNPAYELQMEER